MMLFGRHVNRMVNHMKSCLWMMGAKIKPLRYSRNYISKILTAAKQHKYWHGDKTILTQIAKAQPSDTNETLQTISDLLKALLKAAWFIENVNEDTPNKNQHFFETRAAWRKAIAQANGRA